MGRVLVSQDGNSFFILVLLDVAVGSQVSAGGVTSDEVVFRQEALCAGVVARGEVDLGEPECVLVVIYEHQPERKSARRSRTYW